MNNRSPAQSLSLQCLICKSSPLQLRELDIPELLLHFRCLFFSPRPHSWLHILQADHTLQAEWEIRFKACPCPTKSGMSKSKSSFHNLDSWLGCNPQLVSRCQDKLEEFGLHDTRAPSSKKMANTKIIATTTLSLWPVPHVREQGDQDPQVDQRSDPAAAT